MRRLLLTLALLAALAATAAAGAPPALRARISPPPVPLDIARPWNATVTVSRGNRRVAVAPRIMLANGSARRTVTTTGTRRRGVYRARIPLTVPGRWTYAVSARGRTLRRGTVRVRAFVLPYELGLDAQDRIYLADGELGRIVRLDPQTGSFSVFARGFQELTGIAFGPDGTIYGTDLRAGLVVRVTPAGVVSTLAQIAAAVNVAVHPSGTTLAVATLNSEVWRVDPVTGAAERMPIAVDNPHGLDYDPAGNLYVASAEAVLRVDGVTGAVTTFAPVSVFKVHAAPGGGLYALQGNPSGGRVIRIAPNGDVTHVGGNGGLAPTGDGGQATAAGFLPADVAFAPDGALLVTQGSPVPAIRRIDLGTGVITTLVRG